VIQHINPGKTYKFNLNKMAKQKQKAEKVLASLTKTKPLNIEQINYLITAKLSTIENQLADLKVQRL
jgi:hypothetical protein